MPPYAAELEAWWLGTGYEALVRLINDEDDGLNPRQCGFAQQMQRRLLTFDNSRAIHAQIERDWPAIREARGVDYHANTRKNIKYISCNIFRKSKDGGIDYAHVMDGLGYLDAMEIRRLRLLEATQVAIEVASPGANRLQMLEELDRTASVNFRHLHAGFRTCILIEELTKDADNRMEVPQIMALLNALVPPVILLADEDDVDPTPHSPGLRDSVRFSVFEHLMSKDSFSKQRQEIIQMKLRCWCDVPGYPRAREALVRYSEEFKKLEDVCLTILSDLERRSANAVSYHATSADPSILSDANTSHISNLLINSPQAESTILSPNTSFDNRQSALVSPASPPVSLAFHPLLKGMPGRELSAARTDGAGFVQDPGAPPILCYPDDLSKTEFYQHPFARKLDMISYDPDSDNEGKEYVPPVPPLPHIPENLRAHLTPKALNKIMRKMRHRSDAPESMTLDGVSLHALDQYMGNPTTPKSSDGKRRPLLKTDISEPEAISGVSSWKSHSANNSYEAPAVSLSLIQSPKSPSRGKYGRPGARQTTSMTQNGPHVKFQLANPRLSPMEYCRMFQIEKAKSERENRPCELPKPYMDWFWTQYFRKFLVIPRMPKNVRRDLVTRITGTNLEGSEATTETAGSDGESVSTLTAGLDSLGLMRLSLHLGNEPVLLPCFTNIQPSDVRNVTLLDAPEPDEEDEYGCTSDVPGGKDLGLSRREPAGGRIEDWRPMSEYDDEHSEPPTEVASVQSLKNNDSSNGKNKVTEERLPEFQSTVSNASDICQGQLLLEDPEQGSPTSYKSVETAVLVGSPKGTGRHIEKPSGNRVLSAHLSRICTEDSSILDFATPRVKGKMLGHSPDSLATADSRSPLARFPIAAQPIHRLTPGTLTRRVVGDSGGQIHSEDTRQARLISSPSSELPQGLSADLWDFETESIVSGLQPEPLNINRRTAKASIYDGRRWSRMFDGLSADVPFTLRRLGISTSIEREHGLVSEADDEDSVPAEEYHTAHRLRNHLQNLTNTSPAHAGIRRSASTIITPTQSLRRLQHKASFSLEKEGHSGFTPEHCRESIVGGTFPGSGMMLNLQDTQTRLRYPLRGPEETQLSRSLDDATPRAGHSPSVLDRYQQRSVLKDYERAGTGTPRRSRIMSLWDDRRYEGDGEVSELADGTTSSFHTTSILNEGDVQRYPSTTTRDFSQSNKLKKQRPNQRLTPINTHRFSKQRFDRSTRASSTLPTGESQAFNDRKTPSPTELHNTAILRTPSSTIGSLFRKRVRSDYSAPPTPRTPASPRMAWRPFEEDQPEPPCSSPWVSGQGEGRREKEKRAAYFREKAERELASRQSPKRSSRKDSFGSTITKDYIRRSNLVLDNRQSKESLVAWKSFIDDAPEPLFSSPLPPVPPLPSEAQLNLALNRLPQIQTPFRAASGIEASPAAAYRAKKPQGLKVETRKLRKASRDGARTPSRSATMTPASGSSFMTAFRLEGRRMSFGRAAADEEPQVRGRDNEVVSRRK
ncbi:hypothetical protein NW762_001298 [Fusarium torreyae]|uniref:Uncharacterized protein n=1 Tax=Fusarium torreyae TaxID=1237075 RepID=A0A9W8VNB4_9HYPO|nr:hypothetical protein NW762_001298 [Fusarium torreyae]